jgi:hypothetical protein
MSSHTVRSATTHLQHFVTHLGGIGTDVQTNRHIPCTNRSGILMGDTGIHGGMLETVIDKVRWPHLLK